MSTCPRMDESMDWESLYYEYLPRVYNFFLYRVGDGFAAEDLTAETFEKAWKHRHQYKQNVASFGTWLFSIARNISIDHFRSQRNHPRLNETDPVYKIESAEETVERSEKLSQLTKLLGVLSNKEKELVAFKYGSGLTNKEIAHLTGLSETNVGTILHRAVKRIRERWEHMG